MAAQADRAVAKKVYTEQAEHLQEACRDHKLAKAVEVKGDAALEHESETTADETAKVRIICSATKSQIAGTMGYAAALCTPAGEDLLTNLSFSRLYHDNTTCHGSAHLHIVADACNTHSPSQVGGSARLQIPAVQT